MTSEPKQPLTKRDVPWPLSVGVVLAVVFAVYVAFRPPGPRNPFRLTEHEVAVNDANIDDLIRDNRVALIDFSASWCQPCWQITPNVQKAAEEFDGSVQVGVVDIDAENAQQSVADYGVEGIPHLVITRDAKVVDTITGYATYPEIRDRLQKALAGE